MVVIGELEKDVNELFKYKMELPAGIFILVLVNVPDARKRCFSPYSSGGQD